MVTSSMTDAIPGVSATGPVAKRPATVSPIDKHTNSGLPFP